MDGNFDDWARAMKTAEHLALKGEIEKSKAMVDVAAEIRAMMLGRRRVAILEANGGGTRVVMQATTQNAHTVQRRVEGCDDGSN